jgi:hypothetical protein
MFGFAITKFHKKGEKTMSKEKQIEEMANDIEVIGCNGRIDFYRTAEILYTAGYRKHEWISVEERLPESHDTILYSDGESVDACYFLDDHFVTLDTYEADTIYGVTHWMPLPEPPKMKGE